MAEVGLFRRIAPAAVLAAVGGVLLFLLPSSPEGDVGGENILAVEGTSSGGDGGGSTGGSSSGGAAQVTTIDGDPINFRYGTMQVQVTFTGDTMSDIQVLQAPDPRFRQWTDYAVPKMRSRILQAQSLQVSAASGATYTSQAYAQSVQSALDKR